MPIKDGTRPSDALIIDLEPAGSYHLLRRSHTMITIRAASPCCGDIELTSDQVRLVRCTQAQWSFYAFTCPTCAEAVQKHATATVIDLLGQAGVAAEDWAVPQEALQVHCGAALGWDDVLDFMLALRAGGTLAAALPGASPSPTRP